MTHYKKKLSYPIYIFTNIKIGWYWALHNIVFKNDTKK